jgi:hypothetical protein
MNWVGFELMTAATAAFLEARPYLRLEEIAKKGTNDCSNLTWSTLLTNLLRLHYISAVHIPLPHKVPASCNRQQSPLYLKLISPIQPRVDGRTSISKNLIQPSEKRTDNKIVKPHANTWFADQDSV